MSLCLPTSTQTKAKMDDLNAVHSALPLQRHVWKWNWFENPALAQAGTEGIIVLIVLILPQLPPTHSTSTHNTLLFTVFCFIGGGSLASLFLLQSFP